MSTNIGAAYIGSKNAKEINNTRAHFKMEQGVGVLGIVEGQYNYSQISLQISHKGNELRNITYRGNRKQKSAWQQGNTSEGNTFCTIARRQFNSSLAKNVCMQ